MIKLIKRDVDEYIKSFNFWIAVILGIVVMNICLYGAFEVEPLLKQYGAYNLFLRSFFLEAPFFSLIIPLIPAIPYSKRAFDEIKKGYAKNLIIAIGIKRYIRFRVLSIAFSGALTIILIFSIQLIICFVITQNPSVRINDFNARFPFAPLYEYSISGFIIIIFVNAAIFGAVYAIFAMGIFAITNNSYLGYIIPSIIYSIGFLVNFISIGSMHIWPYSTLTFINTNYISIIKDHLLVCLLGLILYKIKLNKWLDCLN